uniref:Ig-like domain-containing protein n=1 Tax=Terrapene triunguis TaxID=2587831 RepID=A0A674IWF7_9SAUR
MSGAEGAELNLTCSHPSIKTNENVVWYWQFPNQGPQYIVSGFRETIPSPNPEGALHVSGDRKSSALALRRVRLADAAVYYCALNDTVGPPGTDEVGERIYFIGPTSFEMRDRDREMMKKERERERKICWREITQDHPRIAFVKWTQILLEKNDWEV